MTPTAAPVETDRDERDRLSGERGRVPEPPSRPRRLLGPRSAVLLLTLVALSVRLWQLGRLSLSGNEDYAVLSARGILEVGLPVFPSGLLYARGMPYSFLVAAFAWLFGTSDFVMRLPTALVSAATVWPTYSLGRRIGGTAVGLVSAVLVTFSSWEILVGRTARMYSLLSFLYVLAILLAWRGVEDDRHDRSMIGSAVAAALAVLTHQIGATLLFLYGLLGLLRWRDRRARAMAVLGVAAVLGATALDQEISRSYFAGWERLSHQALQMDSDTPELKSPSEVLRARAVPLWLDLSDRHPLVFAGWTVLWAVLAAGAAVIAVRSRALRTGAVAAIAMIVALWAQQAAIAGWILVAFVIVAVNRSDPERYREGAALAVLAGAASLFWLVYGGAISAEGFRSGARTAMSALLAYPPNFGMFFVRQFPWLAVPAIAGGLLALPRAARGARGEAVLLLSLIVPMLAIGMHPLALVRFYERYAFFLDPYFLILSAYGIVRVTRMLVVLARAGQHGRARRVPLVLWAAGLVCVAIVLISGARDVLAIRYGDNPHVSEAYGVPLFEPDHRGPSVYVRDHARPGDRILAMDILIHYVYCPRADAQLTVVPKTDGEGWIGVPELKTAAALEHYLRRHPSSRVWVVLAGPQLLRFGTDPEMKRILAIVEGRGTRVFRGRDGLSDAYLLPPLAPRATPAHLTSRRGGPGL